MAFSAEVFIYLIASVGLTVLSFIRKRSLSRLSPDTVPELDTAKFLSLKSLLETSYQRTLYLGAAFLALAYVTAADRSVDARAVCMLAVVALFIFNIPPRNKVMRIVTSSGISPRTLKQRGIRL